MKRKKKQVVVKPKKATKNPKNTLRFEQDSLDRAVHYNSMNFLGQNREF
jgi:hypothetical protein